MFDVSAYYGLVTARFPELATAAATLEREEGTELYPFLWHLLAPLMVNVGMHGAKARREQVFQLVEELITQHPEVTNEVGAGVVEVAPPGWFEIAAEFAGPRLRNRLDVWEPGWTDRSGPRRRTGDRYGVEEALKMRPSADTAGVPD